MILPFSWPPEEDCFIVILLIYLNDKVDAYLMHS